MLVNLSWEAAPSAGAKLKLLIMDTIALCLSTHLVLLAVSLDWYILAQLLEMVEVSVTIFFFYPLQPRL